MLYVTLIAIAGITIALIILKEEENMGKKDKVLLTKVILYQKRRYWKIICRTNGKTLSHSQSYRSLRNARDTAVALQSVLKYSEYEEK